MIVEESVKGKKKEAVFQCALKACRILDSNDMLRAASKREIHLLVFCSVPHPHTQVVMCRYHCTVNHHSGSYMYCYVWVHVASKQGYITRCKFPW